jgi:hypothetical protein
MNTIADSSSNIVSTSVISCMRPTAAMDISVFSWVIIPGGTGVGVGVELMSGASWSRGRRVFGREEQ